MARPPQQLRAADAAIVDRGNATLTAIRAGAANHTEAVRRIISAADVFYGVFPEPTAERGFDVLIVKGVRLLAAIASGSRPHEVNWNALTFSSLEEALAAQKIFGEPPDRNLS
jgi:hypothetical protein